MTTFNNLPSIFVLLVGLVFPVLAMTFLFLHIQIRSDETESYHSFFFI